MNTLTVWVVSSTSPELVKTEFYAGAESQTRVCLRGKETTLGSAGTFQWTRAVHALAIFLLEMKLQAESSASNTSAYALSGEEGTPAASLDYALSKQPQWLVDMFGCDARGNALIRRLIKRGNPERKRPGPVILSLNSALLPVANIQLNWNDSRLSTPEQFAKLLQALYQAWPSDKPTCPPRKRAVKQESQPLPPVSDLKNLIRQLILDEIAEMLARTEVFSPHRLRSKVKQLTTNSSVIRYAGASTQLLESLDIALPASSRLGFPDFINQQLQSSHLHNGHPLREQRLRVAIPAMNPGPIALFLYLRLVHGIDIEINYLFPHSAEIVSQLTDGSLECQAEAAVIGIAHTSVLLGHGASKRWRPFMLMPSLTHRVVAPQTSKSRGNKTTTDGRYLLLRDVPSNANFYFEELIRRGQVTLNRTATEHAEPDEVPLLLADGDPEVRAVLFFPHHRLNNIFNCCTFVDEPQGDCNLMESILVVSEALQQNQAGMSLLNVLLRDAWLELRTSSTARELVTDHLINDAIYLKFFQRSCGLHNFSALNPPPTDGVGHPAPFRRQLGTPSN